VLTRLMQSADSPLVSSADKVNALRCLGEHLPLFTPEGAVTQNFLVLHSHSRDELAVLIYRFDE